MANISYPGMPLRVGPGRVREVEAVQRRLAALGIPLVDEHGNADIDGIFGPKTEAAVRLFQARSVGPTGRSLDIDGVVGPLTWAALFGEEVAIADERQANRFLAEMLRIAGGEVGVREQPLGSNRGPRVDLYIERAGLDPRRGSYAWCVCFIYWCFDEAAERLGSANPAPRTAGVHDLWHRAGRAGKLRLSPDQARRNPEIVRPGQIFFIDTGEGLGHAGLVTRVGGPYLETIEGNTTDISGSREGIGVFRRSQRTIGGVNMGFADLTRSFADV